MRLANGNCDVVSAIVTLCAVWLSAPMVHADDGAIQVRVVPAGDRGAAAVAKIDNKGTIHVLYNRAGEPLYVKSTDNGNTFTAPLAIVDEKSRKPGLEFDPADMAVRPNGEVHVAMSTNAWKLKLPQNEWALFYARLDPGAKTFTPARNINNKSSEGFSLAADDRGNVTACWLSGRLYANVSHDNGNTFADSVEINPAYDPCDCCTTSAVYTANGQLAVFYREETNNERDMYLVLWDQATGATSRTRISDAPWKIDACPMSAYSISRTTDGLIAVWPTKEHIYFARLDNNGKVLPPREIRTPGTAGMHTGMLALSGADGITLVAWKKDGRLNWQQFDAKCRTTGTAGSAQSPGNAVAGCVDREAKFVLFQ